MYSSYYNRIFLNWKVELYKEIKKNGSARCLRIAWIKFADLAPQIRLQKCRPYVINLLPLITKTIKRREENVHETLADCIPKIFKVLGKTWFFSKRLRITMDTKIKGAPFSPKTFTSIGVCNFRIFSKTTLLSMLFLIFATDSFILILLSVHFMTEIEIKDLIKSIIPNLFDASPVIR